jgi:hypothetical protein
VWLKFVKIDEVSYKLWIPMLPCGGEILIHQTRDFVLNLSATFLF